MTPHTDPIMTPIRAGFETESSLGPGSSVKEEEKLEGNHVKVRFFWHGGGWGWGRK